MPESRTMFETFKNLWKRDLGVPGRYPLGDVPQELRVATATLLLEVIRADMRVTSAEMEVVSFSIGQACGQSNEAAMGILQEAQSNLHKKDALDDASGLINTNFTREQKQYVLELLWTVALSDERLERHEDYVVRKLARMLDMNHFDFIEAKLKAEAASTARFGTS